MKKNKNILTSLRNTVNMMKKDLKHFNLSIKKKEEEGLLELKELL
jgi:hypothetical protein